MRLFLPRRMTVTIWLLIIQIAIIAALTVLVFRYYPIIWYFGFAISIFALLYILKKDDASAYKITWIAIVLLIPAVGGILYVLIGNKRPLKRISAHAKEHALIARLLDSAPDIPFSEQHRRMGSLFKYVRDISAYHTYENTKVTYFPMGELMFRDMLADLEKAERFIFLEFFIIKKSEMWDAIVEVMARKASEGVDVRIIVDDLGSHRLFTNAYIAELRAQNIKVLQFNPMVPFLLFFMNNRDHRKILVVDGVCAFTGGINIADEYINKKERFGVWKDTGLKLEGEAVWSFTLMFIEMWDTFCRAEERIHDHTSYMTATNLEPDGIVLPYGDTPLDKTQLAENIYVDVLNQAKRYVYIFTPYLIISEKMIIALQVAAGRGVDVRIVTPGIPDKKYINRLTRSYYNYLLSAGVRIYEYTPGFMHAKSFVSDDDVAVVGTINLDFRSLYLHFECAVLLYKSSVIKEIKDDVLQSIALSREVKHGDRKINIFNSVMDAVLHLFAPLL